MSAAAGEGGLLCPVCRVDLVMTDRQGIEIDYCPKCRGVWLDRGELDKIIERSMAYEAALLPQPALRQPAPEYGGPWEGEYRGDHDRGGHGGKHGAESTGGGDGGGHGGGHGRRSGFPGRALRLEQR
ncbi:zf-TFIIB domain-containing protein [Caulobacter segnis]